MGIPPGVPRRVVFDSYRAPIRWAGLFKEQKRQTRNVALQMTLSGKAGLMLMLLTLMQLKDKRKPLSELFDRNPCDTRIALELKLIDDEIADCSSQIQAGRSNRK
jgi:hypothetical protein